MSHLISYEYRTWHRPTNNKDNFIIGLPATENCFIDSCPGEYFSKVFAEFTAFYEGEEGEIGYELLKIYSITLIKKTP